MHCQKAFFGQSEPYSFRIPETVRFFVRLRTAAAVKFGGFPGTETGKMHN